MIITLPRGTGDKVISKISYDSPVVAPIKQGQKIGEIIVEMPEGQTQVMDLVAAKNVDKIGYFGKLKNLILSWVGK